MRTSFEIGNISIMVDVEKTRAFYTEQKTIIQGCQYADCQYYANSFINEPIEIFSLLRSFGIDLTKNLNADPGGVWCIHDDSGGLLHCNQVCMIVGSFEEHTDSEAVYRKEENGYATMAFFSQHEEDFIQIELQIDRTN